MTHARSPFTFAATIAAALVASSALAQQPSAALRRDAVVEGDVVTLGDLVEHCGALCDRQLFRAPSPGDAATSQALRALAAARDAGLPQVDARGVTQIVISRAGRAATRDEINGALSRAIGERVGLDPVDLQVVFDQALPRVSLAPGVGQAPAVGDLVIDTRTRRFAGTLASPGARSVAARVSGGYVQTIAVPVLTRSIQRGDAVRAEDVAIERRDRDAVGDEAPANPKLIAGRVSRATMRAGTILRDKDLVKPVIVDRNMSVAMTLHSGALQLSLRGKAMEQGALGEMISVQNVTSKRIVQGVITGPGAVTIESGAPTSAERTASAQ
ncbi:MAG: flagellar basal body P-ring formation chaperone FlgA [Beijerinckiaceae bacterium]